MARLPSSNEERRAALVRLRGLLTKAEGRLAGEGSREALDEVSAAFETFRSQYREPSDGAVSASAQVARRSALLELAAAIGEIDESTSARDSERIRAALEVAKQAADVCQRLDQSAQPSGLRLRFPAAPGAAPPVKRSRNR